MPDEPDETERERALLALRGPRSFGGMGGVAGGRSRNTDDPFEQAVERALGNGWIREITGEDELRAGMRDYADQKRKKQEAEQPWRKT